MKFLTSLLGEQIIQIKLTVCHTLTVAISHRKMLNIQKFLLRSKTYKFRGTKPLRLGINPKWYNRVKLAQSGVWRI